MIIINKLNKSYINGGQNVKVLNDISFSIDDKEFVSIMGPSGSGKLHY